MSLPFVIIGAGGHGAEVADYAHGMSLPLLGLIDDSRARGPWHVSEILGNMTDLTPICVGNDQVGYITAMGNNIVRRMVVERIESIGLTNLRAVSIKHSSSWIGTGNMIGEGTLLAPNSLVTTRAHIGRHCIVNVKASVSHDCIIGDFCNINPSATLCGNVTLGEGCYVGAGATIIEKVKIGAWTIVGAGAVVTENLPDGVTAVGVPARIIKRQKV